MTIKLSRGFTCGTFDLLHAGHILLLKHAKTKCTHLIVGLQVDPTVDRPDKNKPIQSLYERQLQLEACKYVDEIIVYQTEKDLELICKTVDFTIRFLGKEYANTIFTGHDILMKKDPLFRFEYIDRSHGFSSSELRTRIYNSSRGFVNSFDGYGNNGINLSGHGAQPTLGLNPLNYDWSNLSLNLYTNQIQPLNSSQIQPLDISKLQTINFPTYPPTPRI